MQMLFKLMKTFKLTKLCEIMGAGKCGELAADGDVNSPRTGAVNSPAGATNSGACTARRDRREANIRRIVPAIQQGDTYQQMVDLTPGAAEYVARMRKRRSHNQSPVRYDGHTPDASAIGSCMETFSTHFDVVRCSHTQFP